ncbi:MAG TPA: glycosyltransferase [Pirellulaceae bacterium]|nr:glycosyltransferase [Pirellulaceae bacterium]
MKHFIVTRINIPMSDPRSAAKRHDPNWIAYRFGLMDQFAIPAMAGQTERQFVWIWEVDPATPKNVLLVIERKAADANATIVFDRRWYPDEVVIMTRCDSDDYLASKFVEKVQSAANGDGRIPIAVDAPLGWKTAGGRIWPLNNPGSTFVSLVANPHHNGDIWQCSHRELIDRFPTVSVAGHMWCVVIHGDNLMNQLRITGPGQPLSDLEGF